MTEITRNVILDLLPLYIGGEASEDTAKLVKEYLNSDPELAEIARQLSETTSKSEAPAPRSKEAEMEGFEKTKQMLIIRSTIVISLVVMFLCVLLLSIPVMMLMFGRG